MTSKQTVEDFLSQRNLAVVGASRDSKKFGSAVLKELKAKGYAAVPVNANASEINGDKCYPSLSEIPSRVDGAVIVVPPSETEKVVRQAAASGIKRIWMQQGAESPEAIKFCEDNGISLVHGECILMFAEPAAFFHRFHRGIWKVLGKLPK